MSPRSNWFQDAGEVSNNPPSSVSSQTEMNETPASAMGKRGASQQPQATQNVFASLEADLEHLELNNNDRDDATLEAIQANANPAFEIPPHILKNMTPVKRRTSSVGSESTSESGSPRRESMHQLRKKQQLEYKSLKLRQKQELINEKIDEVKRRQRLSIETTSQKLSHALKQANMRRESILDEVRNKARVSFERHLQFTSCLMTRDLSASSDERRPSKSGFNGVASQSDLNYGTERHGALRIIQRVVCKVLFIKNVYRYQASSPFSELLNASYSENLRMLSPGSDIYNLISDLLNYLKLPDLEGGNTNKSSKNNYKSFKFAFILIADTKDAVEYGSHSGMNSNIASSVSNSPRDLQQVLNGSSSTIDTHNSISNSLAVLLYKVSINLIYCMHEFFDSSMDVILNPISTERLKLAKLWKHYHFIFDCFKTFHLKNCIAIANEVLDIIDKQMDLLERENNVDQSASSSKEAAEAAEKLEKFEAGIRQNRKSLIQKEQFLIYQAEYRSRSSSPTSMDSNEVGANDWTNIGETPDSFCRGIRGSLSPGVKSTMPIVKVDPELLAVKFFHDSYDMPIGIEFEDKMFTVPPWIPQLTWRKFWARKLKERSETGMHSRISLSNYHIPSNLRSGFIFGDINGAGRVEFSTDGNDDLCMLGAEELANKYDGINFNNLISHFDETARGVFVYLLQFAITFTAESQNEDIMHMASEYLVKLSEKADEIDPDSYEEVVKYFIIHLSALADVVQQAQISWANINAIVELEHHLVGIIEGPWHLDEFGRRIPMDTNKDAFIDKMTSLYYDIEYMLFKKWYDHCSFKSPRDFTTFESLLTFTSSQCFKVEMGLNSPELRFPAFYRFLYRNSPRVYWGRSGESYNVNYNSIVSACNKVPNFSTSKVPEYRADSYNFLKECIVSFIFKDPDMAPLKKVEEEGIKANEFLHLFESQLTNVLVRVRTIIMANLLVYHFETYEKVYGAKVPRGYREVARQVLESFTKSELVLNNSQAIFLELEYSMGPETFGGPEVIRYLSEKTCSPLNPIRTAMLKVLAKNLTCGKLDYVEANFPYLSVDVKQLHLEIVHIVDTIYSIYNPLLNWVYDDFGHL